MKALFVRWKNAGEAFKGPYLFKITNGNIRFRG